MSYRNWLLHPPVGAGLIIFGMLVGSALLGDQERHTKGGASGTSQHNQRPTPSVRIEAPPAHPYPGREEWRQENDLDAQWEMAKWTWAAAIATGMSVIITGIGVYYVRKTLRINEDLLRETAKANENMRAVGEAQVQAYVSIADVTVGFEGLLPRLRLRIFNTGNSPASNLVVSGGCIRQRHGEAPDYNITGGSLLGSLMARSDRHVTLYVGNPIEEAPSTTGYTLISALVEINFQDVFGKWHPRAVRYAAAVEGHLRDKAGIPMSEDMDLIEVALASQKAGHHY